MEFAKKFLIHAAAMIDQLETAPAAIPGITWQMETVSKEIHFVQKPILMDSVSDALITTLW